MRALFYTAGSPFARAVRIVLDELGLEYQRHEVDTPPGAELTPTLQVPTFREGECVLWESGLIAEYLVSNHTHREGDPPLAPQAFRPGAEWDDKRVMATVQTFGHAATTISQLTWTGVTVSTNPHLRRSAEKLAHMLDWLEEKLQPDEGFMPGWLSLADVFLGCHLRFVQARPLGVDLPLARRPKIAGLLERLDQRRSFAANPIRWWDPGVTGYAADGTPLYAI